MPVRFEIYRDGKRATDFVPAGLIAMGPESVPMNAEISMKDGIIEVNRPDDGAIGISLLWDVGAIGAFQLETTRIAHREKPYNLNIELARHRLMRIIQKQEDWNLFDFPRAEKFIAQFQEAQNLFAEALGKEDPAEGAAIADKSLSLAMELSEALAMFHADLLINRRRAAGAFVRHICGCRVDPTIRNEKYKDTLANQFDYAVLPISWKEIQPQEGQFQTQTIDEWVESLARKRLPIIGGPLLNLGEGFVPDWMFIWEHDFDTLREFAFEYVQKVVQRYRKAVAVWNVVAGVQTNACFMLSFEQVIELTRLVVAQVKTLIPTARTLITVQHPFGEYHAAKPTSVPPLLYAEMVSQAGINFEAFGLEIEMGVPTPGHFTRDLFQLSCLLDRFSTMGRPVFLTCVGSPSRATPDPTDQSEGKLDPSKAGRWHRPWDAQLQSEWMDAVYHLALSKPYVESIAWANLADMNPSLPAGGLLDDMFRPKPSFTKLVELRDKFHQWHGRKS